MHLHFLKEMAVLARLQANSAEDLGGFRFQALSFVNKKLREIVLFSLGCKTAIQAAINGAVCLCI